MIPKDRAEPPMFGHDPGIDVVWGTGTLTVVPSGRWKVNSRRAPPSPMSVPMNQKAACGSLKASVKPAPLLNWKPWRSPCGELGHGDGGGEIVEAVDLARRPEFRQEGRAQILDLAERHRARIPIQFVDRSRTPVVGQVVNH
ncbi:MAG: hypothetical protein IPK64_00845 [bacterium]|nr:hypothetical protein [bacterium]